VQVTPRLTFSNPLTTDDLASKGQGLMDGMIERARSLLEDHMAQGDKLLPANT
jgi:hypothetical protein